MSEYFSHDYNARNDLNMKKLFMGEGLAGIGLYWCIIEMLYEKGGYIDLDYIPIIAFDLRTTDEVVHNVIEKYELFDCNNTHFYSNSVLNRLNMRAEKSEKARKSIEARWKKAKSKNESNTNEIRPYNESNTIKEKKSKENESKVNKKENKENDLTSNDIENEFNTLWKMYPRKQGKPNALKAYTKARKNGTTFDEVKQGIENYCNHLKAKGTTTEYIKHGSTWFNGEGWTDEYDFTPVNKPQSQPQAVAQKDYSGESQFESLNKREITDENFEEKLAEYHKKIKALGDK